MGKLFDKHVRLFPGLVYECDAYDKRQIGRAHV